MIKGLVIKSISGEYTVYYDNMTCICKPRGIFRHTEEVVKVGDYVDFDLTSRTITKIYPRKNDLNRPVIANVDRIIIVTSIREPDLNLNLLDKMISIVEYNNIEIVLLFTKYDLLSDKEKEEFEVINKYYQSLSYKTVVTSKSTTKEELLPLIDNTIQVLTGQSGAGKTTILNKIDETMLQKTDVISKALGRGKHTTRHIQLFRVNEGFIADSPGFGNISFEEIDNLTLSQTFKEIFAYSKDCHYLRCTHINEPKCKVKEMVQNGKILKSRYDNYLLFASELKEAKRKKY